jgi:hypothetical protein
MTSRRLNSDEAKQKLEKARLRARFTVRRLNLAFRDTAVPENRLCVVEANGCDRLPDLLRDARLFNQPLP